MGLLVLLKPPPQPEGARDFGVTGSAGEGVPRDHKSTNPT